MAMGAPSTASCDLPQIQLLEEIVALVVDDNEGREIDHFDAPDRFHAELGIFERFDFLDAMLGEVGQFGVVARLVATHAFWGLGEDVHADTARILWVVLSRSATNLVCRAGKFRSHAFPPGKWDNALATRQDKIGVSVNFLYCSDGPV